MFLYVVSLFIFSSYWVKELPCEMQNWDNKWRKKAPQGCETVCSN